MTLGDFYLQVVSLWLTQNNFNCLTDVSTLKKFGTVTSIVYFLPIYLKMFKNYYAHLTILCLKFFTHRIRSKSKLPPGSFFELLSRKPQRL